MRRILIILAILLALLGGAALVAWMMRGTIAKSYIASACQDRGLTCEVETTEISLSTIRLFGLSVRDLNGTEVAETDIQAELAWPSMFSPVLSAVNLDNNPRVDVLYNERGFFLGDVPLTSFLSGNGGNAPIPQISVETARLTVDTPAGKLAGIVSATGDFPTDGKITIELQPADLTQGSSRLKLTEGRLDLELEDAAIDGTVNLVIEEAIFPGQALRNGRFRASLPKTDHPHIEWQLSAGTLSDERLGSFNDVVASGDTLLFSSNLPSADKIIGSIKTIDATVETGPSSVLNRRADRLEATFFAIRTGENDSFDIEAEAAFTAGEGPFGTAQMGTLTLSGRAAQNLSTLSTSGRIVTSGVASSPRAKATLTNAIPTTVPFEAHGESLRDALGQALDGFSASADFGLTKPENDVFTLALNGPVALKSQSGANLLITPEDGKPALVTGPNGLTISGLVSSRGGGFPKATILLRELRQTEGSLTINTGGVDVKDWRANGLTFAMDLTGLTLSHNAGSNLQVTSNGSLNFDGPLLGVTLTDGELFGSLDAVRTRSGWRVQTQNQSCIGLEYSRLRLAGDLALGPSALRLCPPDGRLLSSNREGVSGTVNLGTVSLPVFGNRFSGQFGMTNAELDWSGGENLQLALTADRIDLPLQIDERDISIGASTASLRVEVAEALAVNGALGQTTLSGALVPANIDMSGLTLDGEFAGKGFRGTAEGSNVRVSDFRDDPIYQPLLGTLNADFDGAQMSVIGPFRLAKTGNFIGNMQADINLLSLNGTAIMDIPELTFARGALQPKDISERLRGLLTRADGTASGRTELTLAGGKVSGTGRFAVNDLSLETFRLGPVSGIDGEIVFDDILALSTPPGQTFTIERMNPGLLLQNGTLQFQIIEGREARLESAQWPFAGGQLTVAPSLWTIAGTTDTIEVRADRIELKDLIETLKVPNLEAEGTVSGIFPIELRTGSTFIKNARFQVDEDGGRLSYRGEELSNAGGSNQTVNDAFKALQNFQYTVLELTLNGNLLGDITLGALMVGKNPEVLGGSEFEFDIEIDSKLAQLLRTGREFASQEDLSKVVVRLVEDENAPQD